MRKEKPHSNAPILGGNERGNISCKDLITFLMQECEITGQEVEQLLEKCSIVENEVNYVNLCIQILSNKVIFNRITLENGKVIKSGIDSRTFTRKKHSTQFCDSSNSDRLVKSQCVRGSIFNINSAQDLLSNRFKLEVNEDAVIEVSIKPLNNSVTSSLRSPVEILIFMNNADKIKPLVSYTSEINTEGCCITHCNLKKGNYIIVPIILCWNSTCEDIEREPLGQQLLTISDADGQVLLTSACEKALKTVFDCVDIDGNGLLNKQEFNLFIKYITGESALEEWCTVEDNFTMENNQLTVQGFLELYKLALETDPDDVLNMFQKMGMNDSLQLENALPFILTVNSSTTLMKLEPLPVAFFNSIVDKVMRKVTIETGTCSKVKNMNDLFVYNHKVPHRNTMVLQNQSHSKVIIRLDCTKSENCFSHRKNLDFSVVVPPRSSVIGHHLFPSDPCSIWKVECTESLLK